MLRLASDVIQQTLGGFLAVSFGRRRRNPAENHDCDEEERRREEERPEVPQDVEQARREVAEGEDREDEPRGGEDLESELDKLFRYFHGGGARKLETTRALSLSQTLALSHCGEIRWGKMAFVGGGLYFGVRFEKAVSQNAHREILAY